MPKARKRAFRAETQKVLNILTHSLYTNREIFLRELLSNASDALDKLRFLQSKGEVVRDAGLPLEIRVSVDKEAGILEIADTGLGMTERELEENLGTIAKSGSEIFVRETEAAQTPPSGEGETEAAQTPPAGEGETEAEQTPPSGEGGGAPEPSSASRIIGRFGVGFYSVFMVAEEVEVISVPAQGGEGPHIWTSSGVDGFSVRALEETAGIARGTVVRAKLKEDAREFLETHRLQSVIRKHSNFLSFPIFLAAERVNTTPALWREPRFSLTREQYNEFYKYLTYDNTPPLEVIHLSVDAPVQFTALIFVPGSAQEFFGGQRDQWGLDLYARRVLIERANSELVPHYLAFLKGVADSEDLPLNISRETLQENVVLRKISQTIVRQVLDHLEKLAQSDRERYETFWKLHGKYFQFAFNDYLNRERVAALMRFPSSASDGGALTSLEDYIGRARPGQKTIWHLTASSPQAAGVHPHLERFRRKGLEVLYLLEGLSEFALEGLGSYKDYAFQSVEQADGKALDEFPDLADAAPAPTALSGDERASLDKLVARMRSILGDRVRDIQVSVRLTGNPAALVSPDGLNSSLEKLMRVMKKGENPPPRILEINPDHPLLRALLRIHTDDPENPLLPELVRTLFDNAQLLDGYLEDPQILAHRALAFMEKAVSWYLACAGARKGEGADPLDKE
ncbi:MAG: molecular chaperone HtpG [Desulfovibrio sp.]|jgi:molecular chaperone HtpG|nr:molecular chaperone HtpG [Desulfovibrio sp.]